MCLIFFGYKVHPNYRLILAGNRDEFYARPAQSAAFWADDPNVLTGKDLQGGGTWFGITRTGRLATITNYRDPESIKMNAPSRGLIISRYLSSTEDPQSYLKELIKDAGQHNGFNLLLGDKNELFWFSNKGDGIRKLTSGIYGVSNHLLDTPWPKVVSGKSEFARLISEQEIPEPENFFKIMGNHTAAADKDLPDTGVGIEMERMLSPIFITSPYYGTRSTTLLFIDNNDNITFMERTFNENPGHASTSTYNFKIEQ
jgi:uncharacterized protein with NRDE domain